MNGMYAQALLWLIRPALKAREAERLEELLAIPVENGPMDESLAAWRPFLAPPDSRVSALRVDAGLSTLEREVGEFGRGDWQDAVKQRAREAAGFRARGVTPPDFLKSPVGGVRLKKSECDPDKLSKLYDGEVINLPVVESPAVQRRYRVRSNRRAKLERRLAAMCPRNASLMFVCVRSGPRLRVTAIPVRKFPSRRQSPRFLSSGIPRMLDATGLCVPAYIECTSSRMGSGRRK